MTKFNREMWNQERKPLEAALKLKKKVIRGQPCPSYREYLDLRQMKSAATTLYRVRAAARGRQHLPGEENVMTREQIPAKYLIVIVEAADALELGVG